MKKARRSSWRREIAAHNSTDLYKSINSISRSKKKWKIVHRFPPQNFPSGAIYGSTGHASATEFQIFFRKIQIKFYSKSIPLKDEVCGLKSKSAAEAPGIWKFIRMTNKNGKKLSKNELTVRVKRTLSSTSLAPWWFHSHKSHRGDLMSD